MKHLQETLLSRNVRAGREVQWFLWDRYFSFENKSWKSQQTTILSSVFDPFDCHVVFSVTCSKLVYDNNKYAIFVFSFGRCFLRAPREAPSWITHNNKIQQTEPNQTKTMMAPSNNRKSPYKRNMDSDVETVASSSCRITPENRNMGRREDDNQINLHRSPNSTIRDEMKAVFQMCRSNKWTSVLNSCRSNSLINVTNMTMDNNISTSIIHQAITSKGDTQKRAIVVQEILAATPHAAQIRNGYGSLPLHVISQRNTKMDSATKEILIGKLMDAYPMALTQTGGVGRRTPLHIIFTDYVSPRITEALIQRGRRSCFMIDKKGFLPAHVACSRHCSPEKLDMLLRVNPDSLFAITSSGDTLLSLATKTATKSHPNYALINDIRSRLDLSTAAAAAAHPSRVSSTDSSEQGTNSRGTEGFGSSFGSTSYTEATSPMAQVHQPKCKRKRKRKITIDDQDTRTPIKTEVSEQANLLLHFSRHMDDDVGKYITQV